MLDQSTRDAIIRAADFFAANPTARTTRYMARDKAGEEVHHNSPDAVCWCALGRIAKELNIPVEVPYGELDEHCLPTDAIFDLNDAETTDTYQVVAYLRELIDA